MYHKIDLSSGRVLKINIFTCTIDEVYVAHIIDVDFNYLKNATVKC